MESPLTLYEAMFNSGVWCRWAEMRFSQNRRGERGKWVPTTHPGPGVYNIKKVHLRITGNKVFCKQKKDFLSAPPSQGEQSVRQDKDQGVYELRVL